MLLHRITNFEIQRCQMEPKFSVPYSRNDLPKIKNGHT